MAGMLDKIKTIVLVMMENRSFDHMLGHMSIEDPTKKINGLKNPLSAYTNLFNGTEYPCYQKDQDSEMDFDIPHEWDYVATQLQQSPVDGHFAMRGFVKAYARSIGDTPGTECDPMGFFPSQFVPVTNFLARNYCVCDKWFSPIPTSTQPNRTMAFSGDTEIYETKTQLIPIPGDIFHWMDTHGVRWRVYHEGFSFFSLYNSLWPYVLGEQFRRYEFLYADMQQEPANTAPEVIVIEPCYQDAPHLGTRHPDDNHAPLSIGWGEDFLRRTYQAITSNPAKWESTVMIVYYDEHGGFFDHEPPPKIPYQTTGADARRFESMGPRIPGLIISPLVAPGSVCSELLDHTSVLQLLAEKFSPGNVYSKTVGERAQAGVKSISVALNNTVPFTLPDPPKFEVKAVTTLGKSLTTAPESAMAQSFELAGMQMIQQKPAEVAAKYPELYQWKNDAAKSNIAVSKMLTFPVQVPKK